MWSGLLLDLGTRRREPTPTATGGSPSARRYSTYYAQRITWNQEPYGRQIPQVEGDPVRGWTLADPPA